MSYRIEIRTQGAKTYSGTGYWQVSYGPWVLIGRPCRDITRAKARADHYVNSGKALARIKYLTSK